MEMCYDGALVMPSNYAVMDEEEMTYVDAGTAATFAKNIKGLWNKTQNFRWAWSAAGIKPSHIAAAATCSYWYAVSLFGPAVTSVAAVATGPVGAVLAGLGATAAITLLWNKRVFY